MPQINLIERKMHLASYTFFQEMLINIKTRHFHSSINQQECLFHRTLIQGLHRWGLGGLQSKYYCIGVHLV